MYNAVKALLPAIQSDAADGQARGLGGESGHPAFTSATRNQGGRGPRMRDVWKSRVKPPIQVDIVKNAAAPAAAAAVRPHLCGSAVLAAVFVV